MPSLTDVSSASARYASHALRVLAELVELRCHLVGKALAAQGLGGIAYRLDERCPGRPAQIE